MFQDQCSIWYVVWLIDKRAGETGDIHCRHYTITLSLVLVCVCVRVFVLIFRDSIPVAFSAPNHCGDWIAIKATWSNARRHCRVDGVLRPNSPQ